VAYGDSTWSCERSFRSDVVGRAASSSSGPGCFSSLSLDQPSLDQPAEAGSSFLGSNSGEVSIAYVSIEYVLLYVSIAYVLLRTRDGDSILFSASRARPYLF